ncbi:acyltransferase family protein [Hyphococcus sp.]|uniref:acyltransferase family protein n=1 Tax=Hyphococcus sp. TaxID=2038636 RepID=UPI003D0B5E42
MNRQFSLYLDAVRFSAAVGVLFSHFVMQRWTGGAFPVKASEFFGQVGVDLVMVFFVLSGFVIAYTVEIKDKCWSDYAFSRATRMYSVALPAIVIAFFFDRSGAALNPEAYDGWWYAEHSLTELFLRGASFTNEFWAAPFRMGSNGPYWSLGYEVWYYVLFGFAAFSKGLIRLAAFTAVLLLAGPGIALLGVVWMMGVFLYRLMGKERRARLSNGGVIAASLAAGLPIAMYFAARLFDLNDVLFEMSFRVAADLGLQGAVGRAELFIWHWFVGALVGVHFWSVAMLLRNRPGEAPQWLSRPIRWLAGASFSIYLVHYPVMQALHAILAGDPASPYRMALMAALTLALCLVFAELFERPLPTFRRQLRGLAAQFSSASTRIAS